MVSEASRKYFKQLLSAASAKAGLPYEGLKVTLDLIDISAHPSDAYRRWRLARSSSKSPWSGFLPQDKGYCKFVPGEIPGMDKLVEAGREIYQRQSATALNDRGQNPFHRLLSPELIEEFPVLMETALSRPLIDAVTCYFSSVPRLFYMDLWVTRPNLDTSLYSSQLYHLDKPDTGIATLFLNIHDVKPENGPFTFLPADISRRVRKATGYDHISILGDGRINDAEVFEHCGKDDEVSLSGPAASGGIVDTSVCLHAGSRCTAGERVILVMRFVPGFRAGFSYDDWFRSARTNGDPVRKLVVPSANVR